MKKYIWEIMYKIILLYISLFISSSNCFAIPKIKIQNEIKLKGFATSTFLNEQVLTLNYEPEIRIEINAPSIETFDTSKKVMLIFYALPNMNTIEETIGKQFQKGMDWHYDIQHIGAQVRFLRNEIKDRNIVVVYLETKELSWPWWRMRHPGGDLVIRSVIDSVKNIFEKFNPDIILDGHSGGGSFIFGYLNSVSKIPNQIKRIAFLDSEYDYADSLNHGNKLLNWLSASSDHYLCAIAYDDRDVIIDGKKIGTLNGGTFYRTILMKNYLSKKLNFENNSDSLFERFSSLNGRIKFFLKLNPDHLMWHTLLVEKNGFIESIVSGTKYENLGYEFWGPRAYSQFIQP